MCRRSFSYLSQKLAPHVQRFKGTLKRCVLIRELAHPRIVGLLDIFEIDTHTFATVLETCRGGDLESYLKEHQVQPLNLPTEL